MTTPPCDPLRADARPTSRQPGEPQPHVNNVEETSLLLSTRRTRLSFQRTRMSSDRTLMSIIRTALSLIGFGFTIYQFFRYLHESASLPPTVRPHAARNFSVGLVSLGVLLLVFGIIGHIRFMLELRHEHDRLLREGLIPADRFPFSVTLAAAVLLLGLGILAILSMVVRVGPFT